MQHPTIKLQFERKLEQDIAWEFFNNSKKGGVDFWKERAVKHYADLVDIDEQKDKRKYLDNFISNYYKENEKEIEVLSQGIVKNLNQKQEEFFFLVDKIFNNYPWPQKEIIGNFSIFDFCPRFLEESEFQVFLCDDKELQLFIIFHECLHFIFYDFAKNNFPDTLGKMNTEEGVFWDIAEVFNIVIQESEFVSFHGVIDDIGYPEHKELIEKGSIIWKEKRDVCRWIEKMLD